MILSLLLAFLVSPVQAQISSQPVRVTNTPLPVIVSSNTLDAVVLSITVLGGAGQAVFSSTGSVNQCSVVPSSETATYVFEIVTNDADQFNVFGSDRTLFGRTSLHAFRYFLGSHIAQVTSASIDGIYRMRCVFAK